MTDADAARDPAPGAGPDRGPSPEIDRGLDGNAAAGPFAEVFGTDVSTVVVTCAGCRNSAPFAELGAYLGGPGTVVRCPGCDHLLARVVRTPGELWLEMSGSASWRFRAPSS